MDLATDCYEHACGKFPNNLELMMGLFNCYVREYSFVKQQQVCLCLCVHVCVCVCCFYNFILFLFSDWQTAIKMYKLVGEERFLLWAVCSIQLQVPLPPRLLSPFISKLSCAACVEVFVGLSGNECDLKVGKVVVDISI